MAINMSGAKIDDSSRTSLLGSNIDTSSFGGVEANQYSFSEYVMNSSIKKGDTTGAALAGITAEFVSEFNRVMGEYKAKINATVEKIQAIQSNGAFQGSAITTALTNFVEGIKSVAASYITALETAENQIAASVEAAYSQQDTDISADLNTDTGTLEGSAPTV